MSSALLLVLLLTRHYLYKLAPGIHQADAWNIYGALVILILLTGKAGAFLSTPLSKAIAIWWFAEEALVIGCSALYIHSPWPVPVGVDQCQPILANFDLTNLGMLVAAMMAWRLHLENL